jgi:hypothetical protein
MIPRMGGAISQKNMNIASGEIKTIDEKSSSYIGRIDHLYCWSYGCI